MIKLSKGFKVNFIVAGTQKGGTTALSYYLSGHPEVHMAPTKELHFFDRDSNFSTAPNYRKYHRQFGKFGRARAIGEATPIYMYWYSAPRRIWEYNSQMKLIILLRNPILRAYSHWNMEFEKKKETLPFLEAIKNEAERCRSALPQQHRIFSYVDRGFYSEQLRRLWHFFPKSQTLVLKSEELKDEPAKALGSVAEFLEIPDFEETGRKEIHSRDYASPLSEEERDLLLDTFRLEIKELEQLLNWDCSRWLEEL